MKISILLAAVALTVLALSDAVAETSDDSRLARLEEAVRVLEQRVAVLENQLRAVPTAVAPARANWRKLRNGMSESEVEQLLGSPAKVNNYGPFITWQYGHGAGGEVKFDGGSRTVTGWREP